MFKDFVIIVELKSVKKVIFKFYINLLLKIVQKRCIIKNLEEILINLWKKKFLTSENLSKTYGNLKYDTLLIQ